ncbi:hypothetical protein J1614_000916 [Plenodomus biglobosus]|nr:hypothetical protein J1614_000916 [Plenodomus biglobosus]
MMPSQAKSYLPFASSSTVVTGTRCHAFPARRQNANASGAAHATRTLAQIPLVPLAMSEEAIFQPLPLDRARKVQEISRAMSERRCLIREARQREEVEVPPRRVTSRDRAKALNTASQRPPWGMPSPSYNRWSRWKRPEGQPECAEKRTLGLGRQEKRAQKSSKMQVANEKLEQLRATVLASYSERTWVVEQGTASTQCYTGYTWASVNLWQAGLAAETTVHRRKREISPLSAQQSTRLHRPRLKITRNVRPRTYRSILKKAGAPKKHKSVRFAESEQVHTIEWAAEHADESLKHLLDEHALRPVSWTTGSLNTPTLRDPMGSHAGTWKTVQSGDDVITGFRTPQQRARVCQVQAFYRAQARDSLATVTNPDIVEVKQLIPSFYGRKSSRATPMWRGVMIDKYDAVEDALPPFAYGEATVGPLGGWFFRSEAFQCHSHTTDWKSELYGRYQCGKGGKCVRFSHAKPCGCEGKWFKHFGPTDDLKIFSISYTPTFMPASTAGLQQWTAVTRGGNGLTVASCAESATAGTVLTEPDVAPPHPRPFVTARHQPNYPRSGRYKARERVRERSRSPVVDKTDDTVDTTKYTRPNLDDTPSFDPQFLEQVKKQMLMKYPWMALDSEDKSTWSSIAASRF